MNKKNVIVKYMILNILIYKYACLNPTNICAQQKEEKLCRGFYSLKCGLEHCSNEKEACDHFLSIINIASTVRRYFERKKNYNIKI
jgi:hypothetical protein